MITTVDDARNGFRNELLPMTLAQKSEASESLAEAILALSALHLGMQEDALQYKARALRSLKKSLSSNGANTPSAQIATCMILCVYGVFDPGDGDWMIHLRGAKSLTDNYAGCFNLSPFVRSWLLYHDALANFSSVGTDHGRILALPEKTEEKNVVSIASNSILHLC